MKEPKRKRLKYMVLVDYGIEGWGVHTETDNWEEAVRSYYQKVWDNDGYEVMLVTECPIELDHPDIKKQADWQQAVKQKPGDN